MKKMAPLIYLCFGVWLLLQTLDDVKGLLGFIAGAIISVSVAYLFDAVKEDYRF